MGKRESFSALINEGYSCKGDGIILGAAILDGETYLHSIQDIRKNQVGC